MWPPVAQAIIDFAAERGVAGAANRSVGQVVGGTHVAGSYHYIGQAVDFGGADSDAGAAEALFAPLATGPDPLIIELYGYNGTSLKNGAQLVPEPEGHADNHTHVTGRAGLTLDQLRAGGGGAAVPGSSAVATAGAGAGLLSWFNSRSNIWRIVEGLVGAGALIAGLIMVSKTARVAAAAVL